MSLAPPDPPLGDGVVFLRPLETGDVGAIEQARRDPAFIRWFGKPTMPAAEVIERTQRDWAEGTVASFAICNSSRRFVGHVSVKLRKHATVDVAYWLLPEDRGQGYATHALRLVTRWALEELGIARVQLWAEPDNIPSLRVAERSGFVREGVLRAFRERDGRRVDAVFYSRLTGDGTREHRRDQRHSGM